ncbi:MAG: translation initiation factor IF-2 [Thermoanaerobaculia bacterium]|nr:translation initiation factor IF-2 [Thermoanaerobaculia bacterium]
MGKIRVQDLARTIGMEDQDLIFKLRSIGVRVEGADALVETEILKAVLEGKKLAAPREVIVRDEEPPASAVAPPRRAPAGRRTPAYPPRPPARSRTQIVSSEPRIQTIPARQRPATPPAAATPVAAETAVASTEVVESVETAPAAPETMARDTNKEATKSKEKSKVKGRRPSDDDEQDLHAYIGKIEEDKIDEVVEAVEAVHTSQSRRSRRADRKEAARSGSPSTPTATEGTVTIVEGMTVRDFSEKLGLKSKDLIKKLFERGIMANINHTLSPELAEELGMEFGIETKLVSFEEEVQIQQEENLGADRKEEGTESRPPVVTIMGHVDHGKTTLLDTIRSSRLVESEAGGITQHIAAYQAESQGRKLVFLDTPGHEAFTQLRARGASATDIVVLVVAADDGVMPQTLEAIDHAKAANVPLIVAINKIDKNNANPERVKTELSERGLTAEDWGGDTVMVPISALKKEGIDNLLEMILLTADIQELKCTPELPGQGAVLEARKEVGRGIIATILVQDGSVSIGDTFVAGATWGRVRSMVNDLGERVKHAGPATPVEITGFQEVPDAGDLFQVVQEEAKARSIAEFRQHEQRRRELAPAHGKLSLEQLFSRIQDGDVKELPVVIKADVQGSVEVLKDTLVKLGTEKVQVKVIHGSVGAITTNDVLLASASDAIVIGFNVRPERNAADLADKEGVDIRLHTIIYELTDELTKAMVGLLDPTYKEVTRGRAEVRELFKVPRVGQIAGCHVIEGSIPRSASARLLRDNVVVHDGKITSLRRFKDDASEVRTGFDCGIGLDRYQDFKPGDIIEAYSQEEVAQTL